MDTPDGGMSDRSIEEALLAVRKRIVQAERDRADLDRRIAADREEEELLGRLLALRRGEPPPAEEPVSIPTAPKSFKPIRPYNALGLVTATTPPTSLGPTESEGGGNVAVRAVIEEISAAGRPVHISELMRLLNDRKISIPGAGTQANLITHLRRDRRLVRPSRGMYGLAEWGLEAMPAGRRRRRRRVKVRASDGKKDS